MNTDDNKAILEELRSAWKEPTSQEDGRIAEAFSIDTDGLRSGNKYAGATMYLAAKRKYQQPVSSTGEVRTRQTFDEFFDEHSHLAGYKTYDICKSDMEKVWNAALASVISTGKRFEVGDVVEYRHFSSGEWRPASIRAVDGDNWTMKADYVRPLTQTVELTDDEKFLAIIAKNPDWTARDALVACQGKFLDELCAQYGVETTRRV